MKSNEKLQDNISLNISRYINIKNVKIEELSKLSGISIKRLKNIISPNVNTRISIKEIQIIAESLEVKINDLIKK